MDATLQARFDRQLDVWREKLLSLDRRQRLLYFRHTRTASLELDKPSSWILEALSARGFRLEPALDEDGEARELAPSSPPGVFAKGKNSAALRASVRSLERTTQTAFVDRGLWVLYLGLGFVTWTDVDDVEATSPLLLVPVRLLDVGTSGYPRVERGAEDSQINPLLVAKFKRDFGIDLDDLDPEETVTGLLGAVSRRISEHASWAVADRAVMSTFTFHKEAMYRDLQENSDALREHPLVQLIALGPEAPSLDDVAFDPVDEARLDEVAPPEELHTILDADASQRRCIVAARDGRSFVMDGPPGTGKSQTIANMIAELMANERSVLFVSEKAAALDVVRKRLDEVGLSPFLLELHSHKATRKAVAQEFGRALDERPHATVAFGEAEFDRLKQERWRLSNYAQAMNEQRRPLEATLHSILGEIGQRSHVGSRRLTDLNAWSKLRPGDRAALDDLAARLSRSWGPVERFGDFMWQGIHIDEASPASIQELRHLVDDVAASASDLIDLGNASAEDLRLEAPGILDATLRLSRLLHLSETRPISDVPDVDERESRTTVAWLTRDDLASIRTSIEQAVSARDDLDAAEHSLMAAMRGGPAAPLDVLKRLTKGVQISIAPLPRWSAASEAQIGDAHSLLRTLVDTRQKAAKALDLVQRLAPRMGLNPELIGLRRASDLAGLAALLASADRPAPGWFNPVIQPQLDVALATLEPLIAKVTQDQESLSATFKPEALAAPLAELQAVVSSHRGPRRFSKVSRAARRQLAEVSMTGRCDKALLRKLPDAVSWQGTTRSLQAAEAEHAAPLKDYYRGQDTDFRRVAAALETARRAISLARDDLDPAALDHALSNHGTLDHTIVRMGEQLSEISTWWATTGPGVLGQDFADLLAVQPLATVQEWAATASESVRDGIQAWQQTETTAQTSFNAATVRVLAQWAQSVEDAREQLRFVLERDRQLLGAFADPSQPVLSRASEALTWVRDVRDTRGGDSFDPDTAWALLDPAITSEEMGARVADYESGIAALVSRFSAPRSIQLAQDLEDLNEGRWLLRRMADTASADIPEHVEYVKVTTRLREAGLGVVIDDLVARCAPAHEVPDAIIRSVLEAWVEGVIADDDRLKPLRAADRDDIVERFRELDRNMVRTTAARVINISAKRRPRSIGGPAAHLSRRSAAVVPGRGTE